MSRIGKLPIDVPEKVDVAFSAIDDNWVEASVKGPLGQLKERFHAGLTFDQDGNRITVKRPNDERQFRALHGLSRTLLNNMITGVSKGFEKNMEIVGVGYRAAVQGNVLTLTLGFSHPVTIDIPNTMEVKVEANTKLSVKGIHPQHVGDLCAQIRSHRPPEPYKGKGIRFAGEKIRRKAGKSGKK